MNRTFILIFGFGIEIILGQLIQIASHKDMIGLALGLLVILLFVCVYWWYNFYLCIAFNKWKEEI